MTVADYPEGGEAQIAEVPFAGWRLIVRRTRLIGAPGGTLPQHLPDVAGEEINHRLHRLLPNRRLRLARQ